MRTKQYNLRPMRALTVTVMSLASFYARPIFGGTSYPLSYGGRLTQADGAPLTGSADIHIKFWSTVTDGEQIGSTLEFIGIPLNQGVFTVTMELDGGAWAAIFGRDDKPVFIEISAGGKTYPRQRYSFVPFALRIPVDEKSLAFDSATGKLGIAVNGSAGVGKFLTTASNGQLSWGEPTVSRIQGYAVENDIPTTGQVLSYNGSAWVPTTPVIGAGVGTLAVSSGGTGAVTLEKNSVMIGAGDAPLASVSGSEHQVLTAGAGGTPGFGPLVLSSNAAVTGILPRSVGGTGVSSTAIFPVAGVVVTEDATEVLTGKTLTTALMNGSSTIGGDTIVETTGTIRAGNTSVSSTLTIHGDVASTAKMVFNDKTSNKFLAFTAPSAITQSTTWILPATDGAPGQALVTNGAGVMSWTSSIEPTGNASGDLIGSFPGPSVASVGASAADKIHSAELLANAATDVNTPATIIRRDASGSFAAGTITANLIGNATNATSAGSFTGSLAGDVTGTQGATSVANVGGLSAANVASGANLANGATYTNTASSLVARDAFGNFDANTITANLTGTASNAISAASFTGLLAGDVRGSQGATTVAVVGGVTEVNVAAGANLANAATANNSTLAIVKRDLNGGFNSGLIISAAPNSATQGHIVIGSPNQTANLQEWQDSSSNLLSAISPSGALVFKDSDGSANYINLQANPTMATDLTLTLPGYVAAGGYLTTDAAGTLSWSTPGSFTGSLAGDVTGTQGATSVVTVGGVSAANVAAGANLANGATSANTASKLVARDASGNFAAGTVTANLNGTATNATSAVSFTGSLAGDVTGTQGATSVVTVSGVSAANVAAGANLANGATSANTASKLVARDASGNFAAGTITADLNGTATNATSAMSFTGSLAGDVTGTQGTTAVATLGGVSAANIAAGATLANTATANNSTLAIVKRDLNGGFNSGLIISTAPNSATQGHIVIGSASQTANLQEWRDSSSNLLSAISPSGALAFKDSDGSANYIKIRANPAMATDLTLTLPGSLTAGGYLTTDSSGALSWSTPGGFTGSLAGDVTGTQGATSVATVGGVSAANVAAGANLANGATSANTASKLVARDASGNFAAGTITASSLRVTTNLGVGTSTAHTAIQVAGPVATAVTTKNAAYTISDTDSIVIADATTAAYALTLPSAVGIAGRQYLIKKRDNSANAVTVATSNSQTIDGASSFVLGSQWVFVTVISDGANWIIAATNAVGVPSGSVAYFNAAACPSGWSELTSGRGRVLVGMQAGGTLAGTVGTELSNLATRDITSVPAHSHTVSAPVTTTSNGGAHLHSVDPPSTATSNTEGSHVHSIDPPSTATSSGGAHSHAILAGPGDDLNFSGNYDGVTDSDSYAAVWRNTNVAGTHSHTVDIVAFSSDAAGAHGHTVDIAAFNSASGGAHDHTVTIPSFTSASTGSASVDVTMPYLQLLVCQKI